jgi:hypothetical protein
MYSLFYLADQNGDINGDKIFEGYFVSIADAQAKAAADGVAHYSIEVDAGADVRIVFIV